MNDESKELINLTELCRNLSISVATGKNWVKLGKLAPDRIEGGEPFFTPEYAMKLKDDISSGKNSALKSRRNKKYVSGNALYSSYVSKECRSVNAVMKLLSLVEEKGIELTSEITGLFVADCALSLFAAKSSMTTDRQRGRLSGFLRKEYSVGQYDRLISDLISDPQTSLSFCSANPLLFDLDYYYDQKEDILGLIYISCKNLKSRKATGSYYTPSNIVKKLIGSLKLSADDTVLDPCCGTGNFLLQLPDFVAPSNIYGCDNDDISVKIARINMALRHDSADCDTICDHITMKDYLPDTGEQKYDCIIGNPPWGYQFTEDEKALLRKEFVSAVGKNIESYDVFIEKSLTDLNTGGVLSFVLPEAILNVKAHAPIRQFIMEQNSVSFLEYLGDVFDGVQCPSIIMSIRHTGEEMSAVGLTVQNAAGKFCISTKREISADSFSFLTTDEEYELIKKVYSKEDNRFLLGNAVFALGIVTGNNREYISEKKSKDNEMVLRGSDIFKYHIEPSENYIVYKPDSFQQVAPTLVYRAKEKLLYRFISRELVFAYDGQQTLSLNSCNILIPHLEGLKIKYILAVLNSSISQFIFTKRFNSVKVLRSHIENIPIPGADDAMQNRVVRIADRLIDDPGKEEAERLYKELDDIIFDIYGLSEKERSIVIKSLDGENRFLGKC